VDRRFLRPGWIAGHLLVLAAVLTCLRLGWWQWQRTQETTGTAQNFGYAVLWPAFGAAFIFMWVRFLHLEVLKDAEDDEETDRDIRALLDEHDLADGAGPHTAGSAEPVNAGPTSAGAALPGRDDSLDDETGPADQGAEATDDAAKSARSRWSRGLQSPNQAVTISVAMVGEDDEDDPELTAYNQALAALAEEDRRRAR
jgi:DNA-binding transcriptional regulator of glucitol operon